LSLPQIPIEFEEWNITVLDTLLKYRDIERDYFDFKGKILSELDKHVCAMANTITGILCLGIKDPASTSPSAVFTKDGFRIGKEDETLNLINNFVAKVDPIPRVTNKVLNDQNGKHFYVILKVEGSASQRPYMVKDSGQLFVRIGGSTRPASRTTIVNLFINLLERRNGRERRKGDIPIHCRKCKTYLRNTERTKNIVIEARKWDERRKV
jgi:predicted HTH transcriptional regulator